jgi:beta-alanine degradation protein BauB
MKKTLSMAWPFAALTTVCGHAAAQDAVQTDGDKYHVLLENACVSVLEYRDAAGERTHQHAHPPFVLYALGPFRRTLTLPDGKVLSRQFNGGEAMWSPAQTHVGENVGTTATHALIVELKAGPEACTPH